MARDSVTPAATQEPVSLRPEELAAQRFALFGRLVALCAIVPLVTFLAPWPGPLVTYFFLAVFAVLGWGAYYTARASWGRRWHQYAFVTADFILLTVTLLLPNPLIPIEYTAQFVLRFGSFIYFFVLLSGLAYVYQPRLVLWGGLSGAVSWGVGTWIVYLQPNTVWEMPQGAEMADILAMMSQPGFVDLGVRIQEVGVFLIVAFLLALSVKRARGVVTRQVRLARERENLGRYFPRKTAQMLADRTDPFSSPREHEAAVLFADLVAFTRWSESHSSQETIALLRDVHEILAEVVFRHDGTLDKFIGDGVMATFGTPEPTARDASNAVAAMRDMIDSFARWRETCTHVDTTGLHLSVGAHYGPVVIGNIGSAERLEFAVLGDTVNAASRLEGATRVVGCNALASAALIQAARREGDDAAPDTSFSHLGEIDIRGQRARLDAYAM